MKGVFKDDLKFRKLLWLLPLLFLGTKSQAQTDTFAIKLIGPDSMYWAVHLPFVDPGAIATRNHQPITYANNSNVDVDHLGIYTITYYVTDSLMHIFPISRYVEIIDTIAPTIEPLGQNPLFMKFCNSYDEPGIKVTDNYDPKIIFTHTDTTHSIKLWIDTTDLRGHGGYGNVWYTSKDGSGNISMYRRVVYFSFYTGSYPCSDVGIDESLISNLSIYVFPNPSFGTFQFALPHSEVQLNFKLYDIWGKLVYDELNANIKANQPVLINVNHLDLGIYFIHAFGNNSIYSAKLMLTK